MVRKHSGLFLLVLLITSTLLAQTYEDALKPFQYLNPTAGYSFIFGDHALLAKDVTALFSNPANLGLAGKTSLLVSFQNNRMYQYSTSSVGGKEKSGKSEYKNFGGIGFLYNVPVYRGTLALGIAYMPVAVYDNLFVAQGLYKITSPTDTVFNEYNLQETGLLNSLSIGFSVEFRKNLFVGYSINFYNGYRIHDFEREEVDTLDFFEHHYYMDSENIEPEYRGRNIALGLTYVYTPFLYGFRLSTPIRLKTEETSQIEYKTVYDTGDEESDTWEYNLNYEITYPVEFSTALGFKTSAFELALNATFHNWNMIKFNSDIIDVGEDGDTLSIDPEINSNIHSLLKQTLDVSFGAVYHIGRKIELMFGYRIIQKPYRDLGKDYSSINEISTGIKYSIGELSLFIAYKFVSTKELIYQETFGTLTDQRLQRHRINITTSLAL